MSWIKLSCCDFFVLWSSLNCDFRFRAKLLSSQTSGLIDMCRMIPSVIFILHRTPWLSIGDTHLGGQFRGALIWLGLRILLYIILLDKSQWNPHFFCRSEQVMPPFSKSKFAQYRSWLTFLQHLWAWPMCFFNEAVLGWLRMQERPFGADAHRHPAGVCCWSSWDHLTVFWWEQSNMAIWREPTIRNVVI